MQIEELHELTRWIDREITGKDIIQKFQSLHGVLDNNIQPNQKQPFDEQRAELVEAIGDIELSELSWGQLEILEVIGIGKNVGSAGVQKIEDVLFRNAIDIAHAAEEIKKMIDDINRGQQWSNKIQEPLAEIVDEEAVEQGEHDVLVRVHFQGDAALENLTEFKDWGKAWYDIGRGIAMANNAAPEDVRVVGASKGSIIITLLAGFAIVKTVSSVILEALKVADKALDIRKKAEEIKALQLQNDAAEKALLKEADDAKTQGIDQIIQAQIAELGINAKSEGDKVTALEGSIRKLVDFTERGGQLDFVLPSEDEDIDEANRASRDELRLAFEELRRVESQTKYLDHKEA